VPGEWVPRFSPAAEFAVHSTTFGTACGLWALAGRARLGVIVAVGLTAAVGTEWLQETVVPLRSGSAFDALANGLGVVLGAAIAFALRRYGAPTS
jgi:VanZ family protein